MYKLVSQAKNMLIVESLQTGKRLPAYAHEKIISLGDIAIFTDEDDVPLGEVLESIKKKENGGKVSLDMKKADSEALRAYLAEAGLLPEGKPMRQVDTEQIERCVREIDLLCHVKCYHKRQGDVYLSVEQRRPVARVISDEGDNYYLDADGGRIAVDAMYLDYLPLVLGCDDDTLSARDLLPMISYISSHPFWNAQVEHIYISPSHEVSLIPRVGNHTILLGSPRDYEGKLSRVLALYEQVMPRIGWAAYDTISVKFDGQVVCTRKNKKYKHNSWSKI